MWLIVAAWVMAICAPISDTKQTLDWPCLCKNPSVVCVEVVVLLCFQPLRWRVQIFQRPAAAQLHNVTQLEHVLLFFLAFLTCNGSVLVCSSQRCTVI